MATRTRRLVTSVLALCALAAVACDRSHNLASCLHPDASLASRRMDAGASAKVKDAGGATMRPHDAAMDDAGMQVNAAANRGDAGPDAGPMTIDAGSDAGIDFDPGSCAVRVVKLNEGTFLGGGARMSFSQAIWPKGAVEGGTLAFHNASGWGSADVGLTTLGTITHNFTIYSNPIYELYAPDGVADCTPEVRSVFRMKVVSEDSSMLNESWPVVVHALAIDDIEYEYEGAVADLSKAVRDALKGDKHTAKLDRVRFTATLRGTGKAVLFATGASPADGKPWFEWNEACTPPASSDAMSCAVGSMPATEKESVTCVSNSIAGNSPFLFSETGVDQTGEPRNDFWTGTLTPELAANRTGYFWMVKMGMDPSSTTSIQRCGSIHVDTQRCDPTKDPGGCLLCDSPGTSFEFCSTSPYQ
jgi:hypothetical protein